jgi:hypothetical protein
VFLHHSPALRCQVLPPLRCMHVLPRYSMAEHAVGKKELAQIKHGSHVTTETGVVVYIHCCVSWWEQHGGVAYHCVAASQ